MTGNPNWSCTLTLSRTCLRARRPTLTTYADCRAEIEVPQMKSSGHLVESVKIHSAGILWSGSNNRSIVFVFGRSGPMRPEAAPCAPGSALSWPSYTCNSIGKIGTDLSRRLHLDAIIKLVRYAWAESRARIESLLYAPNRDTLGPRCRLHTLLGVKVGLRQLLGSCQVRRHRRGSTRVPLIEVEHSSIGRFDEFLWDLTLGEFDSPRRRVSMRRPQHIVIFTKK